LAESISTTRAGATAARGLCALHPEQAASGICERCGSYYCGTCSKALAGKTLCASCLALPGLDYLAEARAKAWGKRDGWIWYFGLFGSFGTFAQALGAIATADWLAALVSAFAMGLFVAYFMQKPWSRKALFAVIPTYGFNSFREMGPLLPGGTDAAAWGAAAAVATFSMGMVALFLAAAYYSTRNRLAFKLEVSNEALARYYDSYLSNPSARRAIAYGIASLIVVPLAPVAIVFAVLAARRADPKAWPPRKGRGLAIAGAICALVSIIAWSGVFLGLANLGAD
jgi:hypothetical protein